MLTSRVGMSKDTVALARQEAKPDHQRRWDTDRLVAEIHYKTYHNLGNKGEEDRYAGFEQYVPHDWNVSLEIRLSRQNLARQQAYPLHCLTKINID